LLERGRLSPEEVSTSAKQPPRIIAVLKLPEKRVPLLLVCARDIVERMTGNSWFPVPRPSLAVVRKAIDALDAAQTYRLTRTKGSAEVRDAKRVALLLLLEQLKTYVQRIANANAEHAVSIIESAGMYVKNVRGPAPRVFTVKQGRVSGEVDVGVPKAGERAGYEFQYSLDGGKTWLGVPFTTKTTVTIPGLKPGSTVHVRYRTVVKGVTGEWSQAISIIVS
jgi:hypothetical protein